MLFPGSIKPNKSKPALQKAETAVKIETHIPIEPYLGTNAKSWTALTDTTASAIFTKKMESSGKYHLAVKVADTYGNTSTKYFEVTVSN